MKLRILTFSLCCMVLTTLFVLPLAEAGTGWTPVVAKSRTILDQIDSVTGQTVVHKVEDGLYFQTADGSYLEQRLVAGSQDKAEAGSYYDASIGVLYQLDYPSKKAISRPLSGRTSSMPSPANAVGESRTINGIECLPYPVYTWEAGKKVRGGTVWWAKDAAIMVRFESFATTGKLKNTIIKDLYDIQFRNPDPGTMHIPADFAVTSSTDKGAVCPNCMK